LHKLLDQGFIYELGIDFNGEQVLGQIGSLLEVLESLQAPVHDGMQKVLVAVIEQLFEMLHLIGCYAELHNGQEVQYSGDPILDGFLPQIGLVGVDGGYDFTNNVQAIEARLAIEIGHRPQPHAEGRLPKPIYYELNLLHIL
jgi:hypothetical protein